MVTSIGERKLVARLQQSFTIIVSRAACAINLKRERLLLCSFPETLHESDKRFVAGHDLLPQRASGFIRVVEWRYS